MFHLFLDAGGKQRAVAEHGGIVAHIFRRAQLFAEQIGAQPEGISFETVQRERGRVPCNAAAHDDDIVNRLHMCSIS